LGYAQRFGRSPESRDAFIGGAEPPPHIRRHSRGTVAGFPKHYFVKKHILIYGLLGGLLIALLKLVEYRFLVVEHSIEIYGGLIALVFAALGIWLGLKLTKPKEVVVFKEVAVSTAAPFSLNEGSRRELTITRRELEILELIASGMSNREIAEKLFVSENTVKTHSSRLFDKLGAKRRTQAVQLGKELGLIP
jgi:DNA-binding CsgD family transcriptional regulator